MFRYLLILSAALAATPALSAQPGEPIPHRDSPPPASRSSVPRTPPKYVAPPFLVTLPSGTDLSHGLMELPKNWIDKLFPDDEQVFVERHPGGKIRSISNFAQGKLDGAAAALYSSGSMALVATYAMSERDGPLRRWDENKKRLLYVEYKKDKQQGLVCLFRDDLPWFVQEYDRGEMTAEYLVRWRDDKGVAVPHDRLPPEDLRETAAARDKVRELLSQIDRGENELKKALLAFLRDKAKDARQKRVTKSASARREELHKRLSTAKKPQKNDKNDWRTALRATGL